MQATSIYLWSQSIWGKLSSLTLPEKGIAYLHKRVLNKHLNSSLYLIKTYLWQAQSLNENKKWFFRSLVELSNGFNGVGSVPLNQKKTYIQLTEPHSRKTGKM